MSDLAPNEQEAYYDSEIAPELMRLGKACQERGIPFFAAVGYDGLEGNAAHTCAYSEEHAPFFDVLRLAAHCGEGGSFNIDKFMIAMMRKAHAAGHSSVVLKQLGVPEKPEGGSSV